MHGSYVDDKNVDETKFMTKQSPYITTTDLKTVDGQSPQVDIIRQASDILYIA